jgi:hypothetical protein
MTGARTTGAMPRQRLAARVAAAVLVTATMVVAGCGIGANATPASLPVASVGPAATTGGAAAQTRGAIAAALATSPVQFGDATRPYRPAESPRLRDAPRSVYQVVLPDHPDAGFIVVYEFPDAAAAVDAGNEEAGYLGTGPARVQFPRDAQHVLRQLGPTLILFTSAPFDPPDSRADETNAAVTAALATLGIGFAVPR